MSKRQSQRRGTSGQKINHPAQQAEVLEVPEGRAEVSDGNGRMLAGPMASVSDFVFSASHPHVLMGAVTSAALLGYHISLRAESLRELTDLTILNFRSAYSPGAVYEFFDALGQQGRAEYQYINVLSTLMFPLLIAICFAICIGHVFHRAGLGYEWNLLPFVFVAVSTVENLGIGYLLYTFPRFQPNLAAVVGMFASFKFRLFTYMVLSVVLGLLWLAKNVVQKHVLRKRD